jgi:hypothetical protein
VWIHVEYRRNTDGYVQEYTSRTPAPDTMDTKADTSWIRREYRIGRLGYGYRPSITSWPSCAAPLRAAGRATTRPRHGKRPSRPAAPALQLQVVLAAARVPSISVCVKVTARIVYRSIFVTLNAHTHVLRPAPTPWPSLSPHPLPAPLHQRLSIILATARPKSDQPRSHTTSPLPRVSMPDRRSSVRCSSSTASSSRMAVAVECR